MDHLATVAKYAEAARQRDAAIVAAHQAGHSLRAIAKAAGLTHPGVKKIVERASGHV